MCGIYAIFSKKYDNRNVLDLINGMKKLQHRGKDGFGICTIHKSKKIIQYKSKGLINIENTFPLKNTKSYSCLGHIRYATSGISIQNEKVIEEELQPLYGKINNINYCLVHNGNIPNIKGHDTSFINKMITNLPEENFEKSLIYLIQNIPAAYNLIFLTNQTMYIIRDRYGIRPLCFGNKEDKFYISSESCALPINSYIRDVYPGEIIKINSNGTKTIYKHPNSVLGLCSFEILYFLNEKSFVDGMYIKNIRKNLGKKMAIQEDIVPNSSDYIVIGIPETGITYGKSYAKKMDLKYFQLVTKNNQNIRTFLGINNKERKILCKKKFNYDKKNISGKKIVIVDDSIVRGNVIKSIISKLREYNALEIHVRIPSPPVIDICELGISIQSKSELIMHNKTVYDVCYEIDANSLRYLQVKDMDFFPKKSYNQCFSGFIEDEIKNNIIYLNKSNQLVNF